MAGEFAPAVGGHFAVFGIQAHDDVATKCGAGVLQKARAFDGCGANDHVAQTRVEVALDGVEVANTAAQLHVYLVAHFFENGANSGFVFGLTGKGAVKVNQVHATRPLVDPIARHGGGVFAKDGGLVHVALFEAHTLAVFQVNGRNQ